MTTYNTSSDAANTMIRAFLTKVGEFYLGRTFNTGSGWGKERWQRIKTEAFNSQCAFCHRENERITIEHLVMLIRINVDCIIRVTSFHVVRIVISEKEMKKVIIIIGMSNC